jgi:hypothetical protein
VGDVKESCAPHCITINSTESVLLHHQLLDRIFAGDAVKCTISRAASRERILATWERYSRSSNSDKGRILDEFAALTGLSRTRAIVVLRRAPVVEEKRVFPAGVRELRG